MFLFICVPVCVCKKMAIDFAGAVAKVIKRGVFSPKNDSIVIGMTGVWARRPKIYEDDM